MTALGTRKLHTVDSFLILVSFRLVAPMSTFEVLFCCCLVATVALVTFHLVANTFLFGCQVPAIAPLWLPRHCKRCAGWLLANGMLCPTLLPRHCKLCPMWLPRCPLLSISWPHHVLKCCYDHPIGTLQCPMWFPTW